MLYNKNNLPKYIKTAGKVTVLTAITSFVVFMFALVFDFGAQEFNRVTAQGSNGTTSTSLRVLNTPPTFTINAYEVTESSTSTPTNSGDEVVWAAVANDANGAPYFLLICDTDLPPTPVNNTSGVGTEPPSCDGSAQQWAVSEATPSDSMATASIETTESAPFNEVNEWYAWVCDDDSYSAECSPTSVQGYSATNSSPFHVNKRPVLTDFYNDGPADPGESFNFLSTSSDPDTVETADDLILIVCSDNTSYNTETDTCGSAELASTTGSVTDDATAVYTLPSPLIDDVYPAYAYLIDEHGHEALNNGLDANFTVNNVAPYVNGGDISLNGGVDITLTVPGGETPSTTLAFTINDANTCENAAGGDEITGYAVSVFRSDVGTSTCDTTAAGYNPNKCYPSAVGQSVWDLQCEQVSSCTPGTDQTDIDYECEFPLWYVADPTDNGVNTPAGLEVLDWTAAVAGTDDDGETGQMSTTSNPVELISSPYFELLTQEIAYADTAPGDDTGSDNATSTTRNIGNTGIDQRVSGDDMCDGYSPGNPCSGDETNTVPADQQQFDVASFTYGDGSALSSTTVAEVELNVPQTSATNSPEIGDTYWGIAVPASVTVAGDYTGMNSFEVRTAEAVDWGPIE